MKGRELDRKVQSRELDQRSEAPDRSSLIGFPTDFGRFFQHPAARPTIVVASTNLLGEIGDHASDARGEIRAMKSLGAAQPKFDESIALEGRFC